MAHYSAPDTHHVRHSKGDDYRHRSTDLSLFCGFSLEGNLESLACVDHRNPIQTLENTDRCPFTEFGEKTTKLLRLEGITLHFPGQRYHWVVLPRWCTPSPFFPHRCTNHWLSTYKQSDDNKCMESLRVQRRNGRRPVQPQ